MRANEKAIVTKRVVAEAGAKARVRMEYNGKVRYQDVGILMDVLEKVKDAFNGLKREMVRAEEETKKKAESSRVEVEAEDRAAKEG